MRYTLLKNKQLCWNLICSPQASHLKMKAQHLMEGLGRSPCTSQLAKHNGLDKLKGHLDRCFKDAQYHPLEFEIYEKGDTKRSR